MYIKWQEPLKKNIFLGNTWLPVCSHAKTLFELLDTAHPKFVFWIMSSFQTFIIFHSPIYGASVIFFSHYTYFLSRCCDVIAYQENTYLKIQHYVLKSGTCLCKLLNIEKRYESFLTQWNFLLFSKRNNWMSKPRQQIKSAQEKVITGYPKYFWVSDNDGEFSWLWNRALENHCHK